LLSINNVELAQVEPDLISATQTMLTEVAIDAKKGERDSCYMKVLSSVMGAMQGWLEKRLMEYHESFERGSVYTMEYILSLALTACKIISEDVPSAASGLTSGLIDTNGLMSCVSGNRVDYYIRSSMRSAFTKVCNCPLLIIIYIEFMVSTVSYQC
jgi:hypothetical protein